jgi:hypothetical protein
MLERTPYNAGMLSDNDGPLTGNIMSSLAADLAQHGYILALQDVRGKYRSGGDYVMNRRSARR